MITEEFLPMHELYQDIYEKLKAWIKTHKFFSCPKIVLINLPIKVRLIEINFSFTVIPTSNQFHVKLGYPWIHSMNVIPLVVYKCLNFPFVNDIFDVHHSGFYPMSSHQKFSLDLFWPNPIEPIKLYEELFFKSYQNFKVKCIEKLSLRNMPQLMIESPILDENMIEPKYLPCNQD
jgi:hypothetical protein